MLFPVRTEFDNLETFNHDINHRTSEFDNLETFNHDINHRGSIHVKDHLGCLKQRMHHKRNQSGSSTVPLL